MEMEARIGYMSVMWWTAGSELSSNELLDMAIVSRSRLATDPGDEVFALLALNITDMKGFRPCYTATTEYVYSKFA